MLKQLRDHFLNTPVPTRWEALTPAQFVQVGALVWKGGAAYEVRARILWVLLGISWRTPLRMAGFFFATTAEERWDLARRVSAPYLQATQLHASPLHTLRAGGHVLKLRWTDQLNHLDAETWGTADTCFLHYLRKKELDLLRSLVACTYTAPDVVAAANACTEEQLLAVAMQWSLQRRVLEKECPAVFAKGGRSSGQKGWGHVLLQWSGEKFGDHASTIATPARTFLHRLEMAMNEPQPAKR